MYSTSSPGAYSGRPEVGAGTGVGASGVIMFSMLLLIGRGAQDDMAIEIIKGKDKKHRVELVPLWLNTDLAFIG
jgi:hypothetical protein